jgi:hypothetical protein
MEHANQRLDESAVLKDETGGAGTLIAIGHPAMNEQLATGAAVPFAPAISWLVRYEDRWWIVYERGWLCITDELAAADIDQRATLVNAGKHLELGSDAPCGQHSNPGRSAREESCPPPRS